MWVLLSDTKRKCWRLWSIFTPIVIILTLLQTLSGKLVGMLGSAWLILLLQLLPALILLLVAVLLDKQTARIIPEKAYLLLWWTTLFYLLLLLFTLLGEQWAISGGKLSMGAYRQQSLFWLIPTQAILLIGYYLVFFKDRLLFKPNQNALVQVAGVQAEKWSQKNNTFKKEVFQLLSQAKVEEAIKQVRTSIETYGIGDLNQVVLLESQFIENEKNLRLNLISLDEGERIRNRIVMALMGQVNHFDFKNQ